MHLPWKKGKLTMLIAAGKGRYTFFLLGLLASALTVGFSLLTPQIIRVTVDSIIGDLPYELPAFAVDWLNSFGGRDFLRENLWVCAVASITVGIFAALSNAGRRTFNMELGEKLAQHLRETLFAHIQRLPYEWHVKSQTGDVIQRSTADVDVIRQFAANQMTEFQRAIFVLGLSVAMMLSMDVTMTLIALSLIPLMFLFSYFYFKGVMKSFKDADEADGALYACAQENFTGVRVVRAFGRERFEVDRFAEFTRKARACWVRVGSLLAYYWGLSDVIAGLQISLVIVFGVLRCVNGQLTLGTFIVFNTYAMMLVWPVRAMGRILADLSKATVSSERVREILAAEPESESPDDLTPDIKGEIAFENVTFAYGDEPPVLKNVSFVLHPGQTLAVLGATGSGKSTLVHLLCRLYDVPEGQGRITIDGEDIRRISRRHLRKKVGLVLQEPFLFSKTIKENILAPKPDADAAALRRSAEIANIHEAIEAFGDGYDTIVGERGVTLSGGQKQRVAIARMLMSQSPIMIFDDSLSAVDTETDAKIQAALRHETAKAATIIVSHRTSTLMKADNILVLRDGSVEEFGSHDELMQNDGSYHRIFDLQGASDLEAEADDGKEEK